MSVGLYRYSSTVVLVVLHSEEEIEVEETASTGKESSIETTTTNDKATTLKPLNQRELAKRLGSLSAGTVNYQKKKGDKDFANWSKQRDPDGVAWCFNPDKKKFEPTS